MILSIKFAVFLSANTLLFLLEPGGDAGILIKYRALGDWKFKNV